MNLRIMRIGGFILLLLITTFLSAQNAIQKAARLLNEDSLTAVIEEIGPLDSINVDQRSLAFKILGSAYFKLRDNEKAIAAYKQLLEHSQQYYKPQDEIEAIYWLTRLNAISANFDQAIAFGQKGAKMAQLLGARTWEFRINNFLSWAYFEQQVDFDEVLIHEKRQAELVDQIGNEMQKAQVYNNLGYDLTVAGIVPVDSAITLMTYANNTYAKNEDNKGRWYTLMNLTWQHRIKGEYEKAINYGLLSLGQAQTDNDRHAIVEASFQLGESLMAEGQVKEAAKIYEIGLAESELTVDRDKYVFDVYYAKYLWETDKRKEAIESLKKQLIS